VTFTERGARMARQLEDGRGQFAELLFAGLTDKQLAGLVDGMATVLTRLREALGQPAGKRR
jgi:DNA-binding MarR family transcriptional regulator